MFKSVFKTISIIFTLLIASTNINAQFYIEGYGGVNTFIVSNEYNFTGNFGIGYNNSKVKIGCEIGLGVGIPSRKSSDSTGKGGVTFSNYTEDSNYTTSSKKVITRSGNVYPTTTNNMEYGNQLTFGLNTEWFIINTFTDNLKWFDIGLFSGVGLGYYHFNYTVKYFQPYMKTGLELVFKVNNVNFLINGDIRYFTALNSISNQTNEYHNYLQQCANIGVRYTIPILSKERKNEPAKISTFNVVNKIAINVDNKTVEVKDEKGNIIEKNDTITLTKTEILPLTILFANDRYDIRKTEYPKLDQAIRLLKENEVNIELIGMASNIGSHQHNEELSIKRCQSVCQYLTDHGINPNRIELKPLGDNNSEIKEESLDRCVIILFK